MKNAIGVLQPVLLKETDSANMPTVIMATVEGDIHDIGKNLVVLMLQNHGFNVIDLGKDVPKEVIVEKALETGAEVIGLSALMTTTMQEMKNVIRYAGEKNCKAKIIVGGAVITEDYARSIGAVYTRDAADTVRVVKKLCNL
jgi:5-methyltetrahydrofolate--homocysteine methyltransferase